MKFLANYLVLENKGRGIEEVIEPITCLILYVSLANSD